MPQRKIKRITNRMDEIFINTIFNKKKFVYISNLKLNNRQTTTLKTGTLFE